MTKIVSSAIMFSPTDQPDTLIIMTGKRHADIREHIHNLKIDYDRIHSIEGFMTSTDRFVDRYEAKRIAVEACQLIVSIADTYAELYSEDVW